MSVAKWKQMKKATTSVARHHSKPAPELDQMLEQRLLGVIDVLHGSGRFSGGSSLVARSSASAIGGISSGWPGSG